MESIMNDLFAAKIKDFRLPRYKELPDVGLYLEQVTKYINGVLGSLGCPEMTSSMVSNYVKKGVISPPIKKQYSAEQLAYLIVIGIGKSVLSIENLAQLFKMQKSLYSSEKAYDYFCNEFENILFYICDLKDTADDIGSHNSEAKTMLRSAIIAAVNIIFVNFCFSELNNIDPTEDDSDDEYITIE
ncbi:MAG: DUF1836 domain-containing protein [Clostridia bacterium]|nr:DUF1836 domain-containing protein [Clostridia bacterium]